MSDDQKACAVPFIELLRAVPKNGRLCVNDSPISSHFFPVGRYCHEAADELTRLRAENADLRHDIERHVKINADLATELAAMTQERNELRTDALRYRWLREIQDFPIRSVSPEVLDAHIDGHIAAINKEGGHV